mmetsp:Transcript_51931/g.120691  ORF Transcript_51931/g.120691 Transcript_51931/m.120691 type:complete len:206 (-) Transcript_51931:15-632(-)
MDVRAVALEEKLPAHLQPLVVEVYGRAVDAAAEDGAEAHAPKEHRQDADDHHAIPLVVIACDAAIRHERALAVGVGSAFEHRQGCGHDAGKEGEHEREEAIERSVDVHLQVAGKRARGQPDEEIHEGDEGGEEALQDKQALEAADAGAPSVEIGSNIGSDQEGIEDTGHSPREDYVRPSGNGQNLVVVQNDEDCSSATVLPAAPL